MVNFVLNSRILIIKVVNSCQTKKKKIIKMTLKNYY